MRAVGTGNQEQGQIKSMIVAERAPCEAWGYVKILQRPVSALNYTRRERRRASASLSENHRPLLLAATVQNLYTPWAP